MLLSPEVLEGIASTDFWRQADAREFEFQWVYPRARLIWVGIRQRNCHRHEPIERV